MDRQRLAALTPQGELGLLSASFAENAENLSRQAPEVVTKRQELGVGGAIGQIMARCPMIGFPEQGALSFLYFNPSDETRVSARESVPVQGGHAMNAVIDPQNIDVEEARALQRWQNRLLRFMTGSLIAMAVFFFVATIWLFVDLTERVRYRQTDLVAVMNALPKPHADAERAYREWYVRAVLEKSALEQRFALQSTIVQGRLWTRVMGFLTGMILCFAGSIFVLGKLREPVTQASAEGSGFKAALTTSSPGVLLALTGAVLIGLTLYVPASFESSDVAVYLPRQVELVNPVSLPQVDDAVREAPAPLTSAPVPGVGADAPPPLPASVLQQLHDAGATSGSR